MATTAIRKIKDDRGYRIELRNPQFYPTYIASKNEQNYRIFPLEKVPFEYLPDAEKKYQEIMAHMNQWLP